MQLVFKAILAENRIQKKKKRIVNMWVKIVFEVSTNVLIVDQIKSKIHFIPFDGYSHVTSKKEKKKNKTQPDFQCDV